MASIKGCFITGTDTGVGKTHIATALIRALRLQGIKIRPRKPVESGCRVQAGQRIPEDARLLNEAAGSPEPLDLVCPYRLTAALSPERAARLENRNLSLQALVTACRGDDHGFLLVEGAGGFYSPIAEGSLNADLAQALALPVILVASDRLGVINQVLLVAEAVRNRKLDLAAVFLNQVDPDPAIEAMNNAEELRNWLREVPLFKIPFDKESSLDALTEAINPILGILLPQNPSASDSG